MADLQEHNIIPLSADALEEKFVSERWEERFSSEHCQITEKNITLDNWRTTIVRRKKTCHNPTTGHRAVIVQFTGSLPRIVLRLEDETGAYVYNGIQSTH